MIPISWMSNLPNDPAVYALYGGNGKKSYVAYVGSGDKLKRRIRQHLIKQDSSVTTMTSAVCLIPEYVTRIQWWTHPTFKEKYVLEAAELVAFEKLDPALRSRKDIQQKSFMLSEDEKFKKEMLSLFGSEPCGDILIPNIQTIINRIDDIEKRLNKLEHH